MIMMFVEHDARNRLKLIHISIDVLLLLSNQIFHYLTRIGVTLTPNPSRCGTLVSSYEY